MSTTCADLIAESKRYLYSGRYDPINKVTSSLNSSETSVTFTYGLGGIQAGSYICVDLEMMYVWQVTNVSTNTVTVERGVLGSTAAAHSAGALATLNPKFSDYAIFTALNAELDDLSSPQNGLFKVTNVTLTYNAAVRGYNLTSATDVREILTVQAETTGPEKAWPYLKNFTLRRNADTTDFASGFAVILEESGWQGRDIRVAYATKFSPFTATSDNIASVTGLPANANDIPPVGAALRLQYLREGQRNFNEAQPDTRRATETPPGSQLQGARGLEILRRRRIAAESVRLRRDYPHRRRVPT